MKNDDLWKRLLAAKEPHDVTFVWVKGHAAIPRTSAATSWPRRPPTARAHSRRGLQRISEDLKLHPAHPRFV
ncbi:MAG: hypothetical protein ACLSVD_03305 [Eggerthellaceae bacterium]